MGWCGRIGFIASKPREMYSVPGALLAQFAD
jgi:hypothetical protein